MRKADLTCCRRLRRLVQVVVLCHCRIRCVNRGRGFGGCLAPTRPRSRVHMLWMENALSSWPMSRALITAKGSDALTTTVGGVLLAASVLFRLSCHWGRSIPASEPGSTQANTYRQEDQQPMTKYGRIKKPTSGHIGSSRTVAGNQLPDASGTGQLDGPWRSAANCPLRA